MSMKYMGALADPAVRVMVAGLATFIHLTTEPAQASFNPNCPNVPDRIEDTGCVDFVHISQLMKCHGSEIKSVDSLLERLPLQFRSQFALVFDSGSRQGADYTQPRILLYNRYTNLVMAVTGSPEQANGNTVELIQFTSPQFGSACTANYLAEPEPTRPKEAGFEFHTVEFANPKASVSALARIDHPKTLSSCVKCHRNPLSPNVSEYEIWPGFYGSGITFYGEIEQSKFREFIDQSASSGRYALLAERITDPRAKDAHPAIYRQGLTKEITDLSLLNMNSHAMSAIMIRSNMERIAERLESWKTRNLKLATALAPLIQGALLEGKCVNYDSFIPPAVRKRLKIRETFSAYRERAIATRTKDFDDRLDASRKLSGETDENGNPLLKKYQNPKTGEIEQSSRSGYVMKYIMGVDPEKFNISRYLDKTGSVYDDSSGSAFGNALLVNPVGKEANCETLAAASRASLLAYFKLGPKRKSEEPVIHPGLAAQI